MNDELQKSLETAWDEIESRDEEDTHESEQGEVSDAEPESGHSADDSGAEPDDAVGEAFDNRGVKLTLKGGWGR